MTDDVQLSHLVFHAGSDLIIIFVHTSINTQYARHSHIMCGYIVFYCLIFFHFVYILSTSKKALSQI